MDKRLRILKNMIESKPIFNNKKEEEDWTKNIDDYIRVSKVFDKIFIESEKNILDARNIFNIKNIFNMMDEKILNQINNV